VNPNTGAVALAAAYGYTELLRIFLDLPQVDPGSEHNLAIRRAAKFGRTYIVKILLALQNRGVDPGEIVRGKNALDEALSFYSIWNFETAELILPHVEPTFSTLIRVADLGYLDYVKLLLNDCRINLTNDEIKTLMSLIYIRKRFPKIRHLKFERLEYSSAREDKKEVIMLLQNYNKLGANNDGCVILR
jgi:hypothetical protein